MIDADSDHNDQPHLGERSLPFPADDLYLHTILQTTRDGFYVLDSGEKIILVNEAYCRMSGYSQTELLRCHISDLDVSKGPPASAVRIQRVIQNGSEILETRHRRKDGSLFDVEISTTYLEIGGGQSICFCRDISERKRVDEERSHTLKQLEERTLQLNTFLTSIQALVASKQAEEALRVSEAKYRLLIENASDLVYMLTLEGVFSYVSPVWTKMLGHAIDEVENHPFQIFVHPDDIPGCYEFLERTIKTGEIQSGIEYRVLHKDGTWRWHTTNSSPIKDSHETVVSCLGVARDITERKLIEEELSLKSLVLDQIEDLVTITDLEGKITYVNEAAAKMLSVSKENLIGKATAIYGEDTERGATQKQILERTLQDSFWRCEVVNFASDGSEHIMDCRTQVIKDKRGMAIALCGISTDITEQKRTEDALRESEARVRSKLDAILSPEGDIGVLGLADIFDVPALQNLMNDFYDLTHIGIGILDIRGNLLVGTGWQDICTKFHRVHPETAHNCLESDTQLSSGVVKGIFKTYRCMNNMWDMVTPIIIGGAHLGNLFLGQFLFDDETPDLAGFCDQARRFGFDEDAYLESLSRVPRWSHATVSAVMRFYSHFSELISTLYYSNIRLASSIEERKRAEEALRKSEERYHLIDDASQDMIYSYDTQGRFTHANSSLCRILGLKLEEIIGKTHAELGFPQEICIEWANLHAQVYCTNQTVVAETSPTVQGSMPRFYEVVLNPIHDAKGEIIGTAGMARDIDERKKAESKIKEQLEELRRWHNITLGREERIIELKREVNQLLLQKGDPPRYASAVEIQRA